MEHLQEMFSSKKLINWTSSEYDAAMESFDRFIDARNKMLYVIGNESKLSDEKLKEWHDKFTQAFQDLGRDMSGYLTHLEQQTNGTDIDKKTQNAGKARLAAAQLTIEEIKKYGDALDAQVKAALDGHEISEHQKKRATSFEELYRKDIEERKEHGDSNRHRKAADKASAELKKSQPAANALVHH